jgi:hypothetical protein
MSTAAISKKAKGKKAADPSETSKLLAAKISQLEQDAAGEKDQDAEIGTSPADSAWRPPNQETMNQYLHWP